MDEQDDLQGGPTVEEHPPRLSARPPLRRRVDDKVVAGVASGLARHFGVNVLAPRIAFGAGALVVAFLLVRPWTGLPYGSVYYDPNLGALRSIVKAGAGVAVVAYFALWVFVPREDAGLSTAGILRRRLPRFSGAKSWLAMLTLVAGAALLGAQIGLWSADVIWAFLLIGFGALLFRRDAERRNGGSPIGAASTTASGAGSVLPGALPAVAGSGAEPYPPREHSPLGWIVFGVALLATGIAVVAQNLTAVDLRIVRFPALGLLVIGAGLLVGAFVGRARWLILPGLLLVPVVLAFSLIAVPLKGGIGDLSARPTSVGQIPGGFGETPDGYRRIVGAIYVDMAAFRCEPGQVRVNASTGFGSIALYVPFDARVIVTGSAGSGKLYLGPYYTEGLGVSMQRKLEPKSSDGATIIADLATGIGDVNVYREGLSKHQREKACS